MRNKNSFEGGFAGETQAPEYRTVPKSSLSPEQQATYVSAIQKLGGFNGTKWEAKITKYFDENDYVIDLQQEGLNQFYLREIFNQYSDDQEDTIPEVEDESYEEYLNNRSAETSKRYYSGLEGDRLNVSNNEKLEVESNYPYPTRFAVESDYGDKSVLLDWLLIEKNSQEHQLLINNIRNKGLIPSLKLLNKIHPEIRNLKQKKKVSGEYLAFINATRELYGLPPYASEPEELVEVVQPVIDLDGQAPTPDEGEESQVEERVAASGELTPGESPEQAKDFEGEGVAGDELPEVAALQAELDRLIEVEAAKLQKEEIVENLSYKVDREKLETFKENARQAIANYQQFSSEHSSLADKSNPQIQEKYKLLEKQAWNSLYNLAHLLDGEIATLPQDRDIQLSHPGGVDTRQYLESRGYKFDENGDITHINDNGVEIELYRAMKTDSLIKSKRPSHVVYPNPMRSSLISNDISEGFQQNVSIGDSFPDRSWARPIQNDIDLDKYNNVDRPIYSHSYLTKGYIVKGLNQNTPDFITAILNQDMIGAVLVDETSKPNNTSEAIQDPWSTKSKGETEFKKIFAGNLSKNRDVQGNNEIPDSWVKKATAINPEATKQAEVVEDLPIDNPDRGSLYYQEIQLWSNIQALENRQKENPKDESVKVELDKAKQAYQEFRSAISTNPEQDKFKQFLELRELYAQAESENTRGRIQKLFRLKKNNSSELENIRSQYNEALEALLKTETIIGVEGKIKEMFSDEVQRLSGERVVQTKELQEKNQSGLDRAINPLKDRIFNWYIKNKSAVGAVNLGLFATSTFLAFTGAGIPLAGAVNTLRHAIAYPMAAASGISSRELIRSKFEDENTNLNIDIKSKRFTLTTNFEFLKFKGGITKLVDKSLQDNYIQNASDEDLSKLVSTLESYYGLNGGKFTELNQQKAYEMGLNELGSRLERANNQSTDEQEISNKSNAVDGLDYKFDFKNTKEFKIKTVDGLVTRISQDRISALNDQKNKRLVANVAGTALGSSLLFNLVAQDLQLNKPNLGDSASTTVEMRPKPTTGDPTPELKSAGAGPGSSGGASAPEAGAGGTKPIPDASPTGTGVTAEEALRIRQAAAAANEAREVLAQDVSNLDSGETIWRQVSKWLGPDASQGQIQEAVEKYLGSIKGQDTIFKLAQQTEGGRELLSQWGIDNAGEMAGLSKDQLFEISKYLAPGELEGITELSLDNLNALEQAVAPEVTEAPTIEPTPPQPPAPPAGTEYIGSKPPAPSSPPVTEAPIAPPSPVEAPVTPSEFTKDLSEILGKQNLTDIQAKEIVQSYFADDYGREAIYNSIINTGEGTTVLSNGFGVNTLADFANLTPDQMYEITNNIDSNELRKILNQTILARFEDAPDMVELTRGTNSLNVVQRYIANELGNLPYDANLGKQVLDTYVQTDAGKQWLYDAIVNNPDVNNQNIQYFKEYLRFKDIKSSGEFVTKFNWVEFSGNRNIPTSGFWNQIRLPNGGTRLQPLSTFLQPSKMIGIKDAVRQVLTRQ